MAGSMRGSSSVQGESDTAKTLCPTQDDRQASPSCGDREVVGKEVHVTLPYASSGEAHTATFRLKDSMSTLASHGSSLAVLGSGPAYA